MPFSMQGLGQFSPKLGDGDATRSESVAVQMSLANGVGSGRANGYWSKTLTLAAGQDETIDLLSLPVSAFGASGATALASVKHLVVLNQSQMVRIIVEPGASNGWEELGSMVVSLGGLLVIHAPVDGLGVGPSSRTVRIANDAALPSVTEGDTTLGSANLIGLPSTTGLVPGMTVSGTGIPSGTKIASVASGTSVVLTAPATATVSGGSITFAWPDAVVRVYIAGDLDP